MFQALILGIVQGLAEFLPISSSAHLIILPWLFKWSDPGLGFDVALHWGTLLAVVVYFRNDIVLLAKAFFRSLSKKTRDFKTDPFQKLAWLLIIASVPGAILGKLLESAAENTFRKPLLIAFTMGIMGVVLLIADWYGSKQKTVSEISWVNAIILGFSQAVALIPGVSRSGATMTAGMFLGFKRADAARFSFLMAIPITFGAGLTKIGHFHDGVSTVQLVIGITTSAIVGFASIKFLLRYLAHRSFAVFAIYRLAFAALILSVYLIRK